MQLCTGSQHENGRWILDTQFDYFLLIAEEQNISRAARRAFISQQSLSKYLQQLEDKLGTPLFYRKPTFRLTPAGVVVLQRARLF